MGKDSFVFYRSFAEQLRKLPAEQYKRIMDIICDYALDGVVGDMDTIDGIIFGLIKPQLDVNNQRYQNGCKGAEFGKLGGRPKKTPNKPQNNPTETPKNPTLTPNDNDNVNVNVNDNDNVNVNGVILSQKLFFEKYPAVKIDNYSAAEYAGIDFDLLIKAFDESKYLRGCTSFKWVCSKYHEIIGGCYRDYKDDEKAAAPKYYSSNVQCWEGD